MSEFCAGGYVFAHCVMFAHVTMSLTASRLMSLLGFLTLSPHRRQIFSGDTAMGAYFGARVTHQLGGFVQKTTIGLLTMLASVDMTISQASNHINDEHIVWTLLIFGEGGVFKSFWAGQDSRFRPIVFCRAVGGLWSIAFCRRQLHHACTSSRASSMRN